ncbi:MAG: methionyl-tRNA formyltransferase [Oligoflexia bacterium]|nr:methionyl-tRNA formyltransferase [Oligoflexia bacterium]
MYNIIITTIKSWNIDNAKMLAEKYKEDVSIYIIENKENFTKENVEKINPRFIFLPHWSWIIPKEIYENFECVVFHMTDLPYGRGGSPLQNLIVNKIYDTKISAIKVTAGLDSGPIYFKEPFNIMYGSAREIFTRASNVVFNKMIPLFLTEGNIPTVEQSGEIFSFKRRRPWESNIQTAPLNTISDFYDFVRMLDAEGYPKAFINVNNLIIEFADIVYDETRKKLTGNFEVNVDDKKKNNGCSCTS